MTVSLAFLKRQNKGYVFSIGDELPPDIVPTKHIEKVFGYTLLMVLH